MPIPPPMPMLRPKLSARAGSDVKAPNAVNAAAATPSFKEPFMNLSRSKSGDEKTEAPEKFPGPGCSREKIYAFSDASGHPNHHDPNGRSGDGGSRHRTR